MNSFFEKINFSLLCLFAFVLPVYTPLTGVLTGLFAIIWLLNKGYKKKSFPLPVLLIFGFYFLHIIGLFYSTNTQTALFDLQVKLPFVLLPLFLTSCLLTPQKYKAVFFFFIAGCFVTLCIDSFLAYQRYSAEQALISQNLWTPNYRLNFFLGSRFSEYFHPSYIAMYFDFGIAILLFYFSKSEKVNLLYLFATLILACAVILFSSKIGIIILVLLVSTWIIYLFRQKRHRLVGFATIVLLVFALSTAMYKFTELQNKFRNLKNSFQTFSTHKELDGSSSARILIWESSISVIRDHFFFGTGTGDVRKFLSAEYLKRGVVNIYDQKFNAHSQFLQTFIALGFFGCITLIFCFAYPLYKSIKSKHYLFTFFLLLMVANLLVESILERQAGVMFFSFWFTLLSVYYRTMDQEITLKESR